MFFHMIKTESMKKTKGIKKPLCLEDIDDRLLLVESRIQELIKNPKIPENEKNILISKLEKAKNKRMIVTTAPLPKRTIKTNTKIKEKRKKEIKKIEFFSSSSSFSEEEARATSAKRNENRVLLPNFIKQKIEIKTTEKEKEKKQKEAKTEVKETAKTEEKELIRELRKELDKVKTENEYLKHENAEIMRSLELTTQENIQIKQNANSASLQEVSLNKAQIQELRKVMEECEADCSALESENKRLVEVANKQQSDIEAYATKLKEYEQEIEQLKKNSCCDLQNRKLECIANVVDKSLLLFEEEENESDSESSVKEEVEKHDKIQSISLSSDPLVLSESD